MLTFTKDSQNKRGQKKKEKTGKKKKKKQIVDPVVGIVLVIFCIIHFSSLVHTYFCSASVNTSSASVHTL